ncbi:MAG: endonuclease/exonuclease/phosphatase family protein [Desulfuromonadales bacterium]|nr:endonuclease/exonuclease/phosphatase family protein [Desulfuromonadales bacterium]
MLKIILIAVVLFSLPFFAATAMFGYLAEDPADAPRLAVRTSETEAAAAAATTLKVLSLNIAHGRGSVRNQLFVARRSFEDNLARISQVLRHHRADIVALQEVDTISLWSGRFDHAEAIASQAGYPWKAHALHASSRLFSFGTALLSHLPITSIQAQNFAPTPPTLRKGFVVGQVAWAKPGAPAGETVMVDVVSVHLDFLSRPARDSQVEEMAEVLARRQNPLIVLGDFNSGWQEEDSPVQRLAKRLHLQAFQPEGRQLATHQNMRIDWILISPQLEFKSHATLPDLVSDHLAIVAEVGLAGQGRVAN